MGSFPNTFSTELTPLPADLGERGNEARDRLAEKGFVVVAGLTHRTLGAVQKMAAQPHIVKYCPKDQTEKRFGTAGDTKSAEKWLKEGSGRAVFLLARTATGEALALDSTQSIEDQITVEGYGWVGHKPCEQLPNSPTTFAVRVGENARGYKAGEPFTTAIITGGAALYGATGFGLETWEGNPKAVQAYEDAGWQFVTSEPGERDLPEGGTTPDVRRYYAYPDEFLPVVQTV